LITAETNYYGFSPDDFRRTPMTARATHNNESNPPSNGHPDNSGASTALDALLTVEEVATKLCVAPCTVLSWARTGTTRGGVTVRLESQRFGKTVRFTPEALLQFSRTLGALNPPVRHRAKKTSKAVRTSPAAAHLTPRRSTRRAS
jgi:hypothetical protein